jgi:hypothetical protein
MWHGDDFMIPVFFSVCMRPGGLGYRNCGHPPLAVSSPDLNQRSAILTLI